MYMRNTLHVYQRNIYFSTIIIGNIRNTYSFSHAPTQAFKQSARKLRIDQIFVPEAQQKHTKKYTLRQNSWPKCQRQLFGAKPSVNHNFGIEPKVL